MKMKILLTAINAKYIHTNPAIRSLKAYAAEWEDITDLVEYTINQQTEWMLADLYARKPDVIAFSCYIWNWTVVRQLLRELGKVLPETEIWLGGPEVTYDAPRLLEEYPALKGIMVGEGEETFRELCSHYAAGKPELNAIAGLCLPGEQGAFYTPAREPVKLDSIPFFYGDMKEFENRIPYYESSRGCPYHCSYCLSSIEKHVRFRSPEKVLPELDHFLACRVPQVKFIDRTFNCDHRHCMTILKHIAEKDNGVTNFHFEIAADLLREEELQLLNSLRPGLVQLEIGVQTTHPETVEAIDRKMDLNRLKSVVSRLKQGHNIHLHLDLIAGLPYEDLQTFRHSFNEVYAMGAEDLQLGFLKVLKGSPMETRAKEYGLKYLSDPPYEVLSTRWLGYGDIRELKSVEAMLELYHNSGQFNCMLRELEKETPDAYELYLTLAGHYARSGYEVNQPSRMARYEVLLDFACARHPEKREIYAELLTMDCYLREKCKRRPGFAKDLMPWKEALRTAPRKNTDHAEVFAWTVWEQDVKPVEGGVQILGFDYENRDPLSHNAAVYPVRREERR